MSSPSSNGSPAAAPPALEQPAQEQPSPEEFDTSFFPAPSPFYLRYTSQNLALPADALVSDVPGEPEPFLRGDMEPPNVDWIVEDGSYSVFGETWPIEEKVPTLEEMGVKEMFERGTNRKASLQTLLQTFIVTYTQLLDAILAPPPSLARPRPPLPDGSQPPTDPERMTEHLRLIAMNMHYLVNELRPVQARETLKMMMRSQIELRKVKTAAVKQRCATIRSTLSTLHANVSHTSSNASSTPSANRVEVDLVVADEATEILRRLQEQVDALGT
ncbi:hypothetical protein JCM11641_005012 [Rhodosporidiobolus odoratus]